MENGRPPVGFEDSGSSRLRESTSILNRFMAWHRSPHQPVFASKYVEKVGKERKLPP